MWYTKYHFRGRFSELISTQTFHTHSNINKKLSYRRVVGSEYYKSFVYNVIDSWDNVSPKKKPKTPW